MRYFVLSRLMEWCLSANLAQHVHYHVTMDFRAVLPGLRMQPDALLQATAWTLPVPLVSACQSGWPRSCPRQPCCRDPWPLQDL